MTRPVESDYMTHTAYSRALEDYCDVLAQQIKGLENSLMNAGMIIEHLTNRLNQQ